MKTVDEARFTLEDELDLRLAEEPAPETPRRRRRRAAPRTAAQPQNDAPKSPGRLLYEWLQPMVAAVVTVTLLLSFFTPVVGVVGPSMRETLQSGDRLLTLRPWLTGELKRGDIVIVRKESFDSQPIVKRVIATAGETVDIDFTSGTVTVDGRILSEPYIRELTFREEGTAFPLTVEEGCLFLMGDNRNDSADSRSSALGTVDERCVIGRAVLLLLPGADAGSGRRDFSRMGLIR